MKDMDCFTLERLNGIEEVSGSIPLGSTFLSYHEAAVRMATTHQAAKQFWR